MDESSTLTIIATLIAIDAIITIGYAALQNAKQSELQEQAEAGRASAKTSLALLEGKSQLYITYILTNSVLLTGVILLTASWFITPELALLEQPFAIAGIFGVGLLALMLGTVVPESIGSAYSTVLLPIFSIPLRFINIILMPISSIFLGLSYLLARLFGSNDLVNTVTEEEIMTLINAGNSGGTIEDEEREMIFSILQLDQTYAREIMVPRIDIQAIDINTTLDVALELFMETGFSRLPIYEENVDNIVGLLYAKDLLNMWQSDGLQGHTARDLVRSAYYVPETMTADSLLRDMQARNIHMAVVVDEYGGTSGLVTIENIMEEIVGDIRDEYDLNEENEYSQQADDEFVIDAGMDVDDVNELLGTSISSDDSDTLGGFIYLRIGRVPIVGEEIDSDELHMTIRSIEGRRIRKVLVKVKPSVNAEDDAPEPENSPETDEAESGDNAVELADAS